MKTYLPLCLLASVARATADSGGCPKEFRTVIGPYNTAEDWAPVRSALEWCPDMTTFDLRLDMDVCSPSGIVWFPFALSGRDKFASAPSAIALDGYSLGHREWDKIRPKFFTWPLLRSMAEEVRSAIEFREWEPLESTPIYAWYESGRARAWFAAVLLPARQRLKTNLELWLDAMDFSRVRHLALVNCNDPTELLAEKLLPEIPGLRSLEIESALYSKAVNYTLALSMTPNTLQHLSLRNTYQPWNQIEPAVEHHGQSLTSLEWRSDERYDRDVAVLSPTYIRRLRALAPGLNKLTINLKSHGTAWPWAELDALREEAPTGLTNLSVYLVGSELPLLTTDAATAMFCRLVGGSGVERPWHTVRFFTGVWHWRQNPRHRHEPTGLPEFSDFEWYRGRFAWARCSAWRSDGSLKAPEETPCEGFNLEPEEPSPEPDHCVEYDQYYAQLAFERRQQVQWRLLGSSEDRKRLPRRDSNS